MGKTPQVFVIASNDNLIATLEVVFAIETNREIIVFFNFGLLKKIVNS